MKHLIIIFLLLNILPYDAFTQSHFPHLTTLRLENECGDEPYILIHYDEALGEKINTTLNLLPKDHPLYESGEVLHDILALKLKFQNTLKSEYYLVYSSGPSCGPSFYFYDVSNNERLGSVFGLELYIPGGDAVYTMGHIFSTYNTRRKYVYNGTEFEYITPDFYYVGLKTKTLKPITLYTDELLTTRLAQLPANYEIEVIAAKPLEGFNINKIKYLVKTSFGLLGWCQIQAGLFHSIDVEGIEYRGS